MAWLFESVKLELRESATVRGYPQELPDAPCLFESSASWHRRGETSGALKKFTSQVHHDAHHLPSPPRPPSHLRSFCSPHHRCGRVSHRPSTLPRSPRHSRCIAPSQPKRSFIPRAVAPAQFFLPSQWPTSCQAQTSPPSFLRTLTRLPLPTRALLTPRPTLRTSNPQVCYHK